MCSLIILLLCKNICCGYSLESPCLGAIKTYVVGTHEAILMSTHNIRFYGELTRIIFQLS